VRLVAPPPPAGKPFNWLILLVLLVPAAGLCWFMVVTLRRRIQEEGEEEWEEWEGETKAVSAEKAPAATPAQTRAEHLFRVVAEAPLASEETAADDGIFGVFGKRTDNHEAWMAGGPRGATQNRGT